MEKTGTVPDAYTYNILINDHCKNGDLQRANGFLKDMLEKNLGPNNVTYSTLIDGFCKQGKLDKAIGLYEDMVKKCIKADPVTYTALIDALCRAGRMEEAGGFVQKMREEGFVGDCASYGALNGGYRGDANLRVHSSRMMRWSTMGFCLAFSHNHPSLMRFASRLMWKLLQRCRAIW